MTDIRTKRATLVFNSGGPIPDDLRRDYNEMISGIAKLCEVAKTGDPLARDRIRSIIGTLQRDGFA